jgi:hypothetical protein
MSGYQRGYHITTRGEEALSLCCTLTHKITTPNYESHHRILFVTTRVWRLLINLVLSGGIFDCACATELDAVMSILSVRALAVVLLRLAPLSLKMTRLLYRRRCSQSSQSERGLSMSNLSSVR